MSSTSVIMDRPNVRRETVAGELARCVSAPGTLVRADEPLAKRTTLRVGGPADVYVEPATEADLAAVVRFCRQRKLKIFVLGRGSNLLVRDGGIRGVVISLAHPEFSRISLDGEILRCGAGAKLKQVAVEAKRYELSGVEFLEGIPGTIGGALRMNAGAMGKMTFDALASVRFMDYEGQSFETDAKGIHVEYRNCPLFRNHIALAAAFRCTKASRAEIEERMNAFSRKRWESQPAAPSAGCMFKNPPTVPAGKLIDELGLKGLRVGGAMVSREHGNFIVNDGEAMARDVLELIEKVRQQVKAARGIDLETEVEIVGEA